MNVEISNTQKEALAEKVSLCVEFLKSTIQPHLTSSDKLVVGMGEVLDLCLTSTKIYVRCTRWFNLGIDIPMHKILYLEKDRKNAKRFICDAYPELAADFLKYWGNAKAYLIKEVDEKNKRVDEFNSFVDSFKL